MLEIASKIIVCLVLVSIISAILGYLVAKAKYQKKEIKYDNNVAPLNKKTGNIYNKPLILGQPRPTGKDDLKEIEGIDSEMEIKLNTLGIFHFEQIAKWNNKNVEWVSEYFEIETRIADENWVSQAKDFTRR